MSLARRPHWATREYHDFLRIRAGMPFAWGKNDCALFAADGVWAITGVDVAEEFRGAYEDEAGAWEAVKRIANGSTVEDAVAYCLAKHGVAELAQPLMAQRGDVAIVEDAGRGIAGLVHLSGRHVVSVGEAGLLRLPITAVRRAWHYE